MLAKGRSTLLACAGTDARPPDRGGQPRPPRLGRAQLLGHDLGACGESSASRRGRKMNRKWIVTSIVATAVLASAVLAASIATAAGPPSVAAGPAFGFIPSHNAGQKAHGRQLPL